MTFDREKFVQMTHQENFEKDLSAEEQSKILENISETEFSVVLIVNTASQCGFTGQYEGLENLYKKYKDRGLLVLAQPSNVFMNQEPGTDEEIKQFCESKFGVTFPILPKQDLKDSSLFAALEEVTGIQPKWNFHKYIFCPATGKIYSRCHFVQVDEQFEKEIEHLLL